MVFANEHKESQLAKVGLKAYAQHPLWNAVGMDRSLSRKAPRTKATLLHELSKALSKFRQLWINDSQAIALMRVILVVALMVGLSGVVIWEW